MTLALAQIFHALSSRSRHQSAFTRPFANIWLGAAILTCVILQLAAVYWPFLRVVLHTVPLSLEELVGRSRMLADSGRGR
jgi:P-type Ca2+ transporter type 2C